MAEFSIHNVTNIRVTEIRDHGTFITRSIVIEDEKGGDHEVTFFCNNIDDEQALRVWL